MEHMLAYEFYHHDHENEPQLIGILPERRKDPQRINPESIMNWAKKILGNGWNMSRIDFVEVTIDKMTGEMMESKQNVKDFEEEKKY
ncbi:MAG: hypothetical protein KGZ49_09590 [Syntrophaceae bacterium]|nr:hypothetical protein [Syntrophaceae bacterium]